MLLASVLGPQARALIGWQNRKPGVRLVSQRWKVLDRGQLQDNYRQERPTNTHNTSSNSVQGKKGATLDTVCNYGTGSTFGVAGVIEKPSQPAKSPRPARPARGKEPPNANANKARPSQCGLRQEEGA